jgi:N-acetylglucosamine malate deacetylase 2
VYNTTHTSFRKALFIFAHPDDETFGTGGTIAKLVKAGAVVKVVTATTGQAGMTGKYGDVSPEELGKIRSKEHAKAAEILGISEIKYLGLMDGEVDKSPVSELKDLLLPILKEENPDIVFTFEKNGVSNHPDHKQMSKAATGAFKDWMKEAGKHVRLYHVCVPKSYLKEYEKSGLTMKAFGSPLGTPDDEITTIVDISDVFEIKDRAARAHESQAKDWERFSKRMEIVDLKKEYFKLIAENSLS